MFQIFMIIGWAALLVLVLYVWADVREIAAIVKDNKRELVRSSFGGRTSGRQQGYPESAAAEEYEVAEAEEPRMTGGLKDSEEQVLQEVLAEFLG